MVDQLFNNNNNNNNKKRRTKMIDKLTPNKIFIVPTTTTQFIVVFKLIKNCSFVVFFN